MIAQYKWQAACHKPIENIIPWSVLSSLLTKPAKQATQQIMVEFLSKVLKRTPCCKLSTTYSVLFRTGCINFVRGALSATVVNNIGCESVSVIEKINSSNMLYCTSSQIVCVLYSLWVQSSVLIWWIFWGLLPSVKYFFVEPCSID